MSIVRLAKAAEPAEIGHALLQGREAAIRRVAFAVVEQRAPRVILRARALVPKAVAATATPNTTSESHIG
jgi:hypothetical protein